MAGISAWLNGGVHLPLAIMNNIEQQRVHSALWQFPMGGSIVSFTQVKLTFPYIFLLVDFSLFCPISWLFRMGSPLSHWTVKSSLCTLAVSNGGVHLPMVSSCVLVSIYIYRSAIALVFSYIFLYVTVSNGLSLTTLNSEEFTLPSGSFDWGGMSAGSWTLPLPPGQDTFEPSIL